MEEGVQQEKLSLMRRTTLLWQLQDLMEPQAAEDIKLNLEGGRMKVWTNDPLGARWTHKK